MCVSGSGVAPTCLKPYCDVRELFAAPLGTLLCESKRAETKAEMRAGQSTISHSEFEIF